MVAVNAPAKYGRNSRRNSRTAHTKKALITGSHLKYAVKIGEERSASTWPLIILSTALASTDIIPVGIEDFTESVIADFKSFLNAIW